MNTDYQILPASPDHYPDLVMEVIFDSGAITAFVSRDRSLSQTRVELTHVEPGYVFELDTLLAALREAEGGVV